MPKDYGSAAEARHKKERRRGPQTQASKKTGGASDAQQKSGHRRDRIRLLEHLLKKEELTAQARAGIEKEIVRLKQEQQADALKERERKLAVRYHKVRFFERKKIERHIQHLQQAIDNQPDARASPEQVSELQEWNQKLVYVRHYPPGYKYVALLKNAETPEAQAALEAKRAEMHALVAARLAAERQAQMDKAALNEADEGGIDTARAVAEAAARQAQVTGGAATTSPAGKAHKAKHNAPAAGAAAPRSTSKVDKPAVKPARVPDGATNASDDDFFLTDDEDNTQRPSPILLPPEVPGRDAAAAGKAVERPVAKSWARPSGLDDASDSEGLESDALPFEATEHATEDADMSSRRLGRTSGRQQAAAPDAEDLAQGHSAASGAQRRRRRRTAAKGCGEGAAIQQQPTQTAAVLGVSGQEVKEDTSEPKRKRRRRRKEINHDMGV